MPITGLPGSAFDDHRNRLRRTAELKEAIRKVFEGAKNHYGAAFLVVLRRRRILWSLITVFSTATPSGGTRCVRRAHLVRQRRVSRQRRHRGILQPSQEEWFPYQKSGTLAKFPSRSLTACGDGNPSAFNGCSATTAPSSATPK